MGQARLHAIVFYAHDGLTHRQLMGCERFDGSNGEYIDISYI